MSTLQIDYFTHPGAFYSTTGAFLMQREVENNVTIGLTLNAMRGGSSRVQMWRVHDGGTVIGAAMLTPGRKLNLVTPAEAIATALAERLLADGVALPGIRGEPAACQRFAEVWSQGCGQQAHMDMPQLLYRLDVVLPTTGVTGVMRKAYPVERAQLITWMDSFEEDAFGTFRPGESERYIDILMEASDERGIWVWDVGDRPVSMASVNRLTPHGAVVSGVYTPPEHRRNGYAGALTAAVSAHLLASGRRWCALYTDRNNLTSNKIYQRIGYTVVAEQEDWVFAESQKLS